MTNQPANIWQQGLWQNNPALVQMLGLCPLLAVSNTAINGLALGLATLFTLVLSNCLVSATRHWIIQEIRIPAYVLLIAGIVTMVGLLMNAFANPLHKQLGIFIPLIITNCTILARAEAFASKNNVLRSLLDGITHGLGFAIVLLALGVIRELLGTGTLFADAHLLFPQLTSSTLLFQLTDFRGPLFAILPPGAFIILGLFIATKNFTDYRRTIGNSVEHKSELQ